LFKKEYIQYVDWPGRATLDDPNFVRLVTEEASVSLRVIFVLDSTRPISSAAQVLFELLDLVNKRKQRELITIVIAFNKKDLIKSKNARRIKIQMRSELEKILTVHF
jgi:signal recognition particle receptor subunit beta